MTVFLTLASFLAGSFVFPQPAAAQLFMPLPGEMVAPSKAGDGVALRGIKINPNQPLRFEFLISSANNPNIKESSQRLIKYFLACLSLPEEDLWVNLSPYEKDKMIPQTLGQTELGRDLLAQDYVLKQLTASMIDPRKELGKEFWARIYKKAQEQFGTTEVPVNTFNKVWILADTAKVFVNKNEVYVVNSHMKVMLEEDYLALNKNSRESSSQAHTISSKIIRDIILPEIEKEVNTGEHFAPLRQIFNAFILANWYKKNLKKSILNQFYADKAKVNGLFVIPAKAGIQNMDPNQIYQMYIKAYKKGVFNFIQDPDPTNVGSAAASLPRKYFSGGTVFRSESFAQITNPSQLTSQDAAQLGKVDFAVTADLKSADIAADAATVALPSSHQYTVANDEQQRLIYEAIKSETQQGQRQYIKRFRSIVDKTYLTLDLQLKELESFPDQERIFHQGLLRDEDGVYWIVKQKEEEIAGKWKNIAHREYFVSLIMSGRANMADIRLLTSQEASKLPFIDQTKIGEFYLTRVVTAENVKQQSLIRDSSKAFSTNLVAHLFLGKNDQHLLNWAFAGTPVSVDHDFVGLSIDEGEPDEPASVLIRSLWDHTVLRLVVGLKPSLHSPFYDDLRALREMSDFRQEMGGRDDMRSFKSVFTILEDFNFGQGYINAEQLNPEYIRESIKQMKAITPQEIHSKALEAGYPADKARKLTKYLQSQQRILGSMLDLYFSLLTRTQYDFYRLDDQDYREALFNPAMSSTSQSTAMFSVATKVPEAYGESRMRKDVLLNQEALIAFAKDFQEVLDSIVSQATKDKEETVLGAIWFSPDYKKFSYALGNNLKKGGTDHQLFVKALGVVNGGNYLSLTYAFKGRSSLLLMPQRLGGGKIPDEEVRNSFVLGVKLFSEPLKDVKDGDIPPRLLLFWEPILIKAVNALDKSEVVTLSEAFAQINKDPFVQSIFEDQSGLTPAMISAEATGEAQALVLYKHRPLVQQKLREAELSEEDINNMARLITNRLLLLTNIYANFNAYLKHFTDTGNLNQDGLRRISDTVITYAKNIGFDIVQDKDLLEIILFTVLEQIADSQAEKMLNTLGRNFAVKGEEVLKMLETFPQGSAEHNVLSHLMVSFQEQSVLRLPLSVELGEVLSQIKAAFKDNFFDASRMEQLIGRADLPDADRKACLDMMKFLQRRFLAQNQQMQVQVEGRSLHNVRSVTNQRAPLAFDLKPYEEKVIILDDAQESINIRLWKDGAGQLYYLFGNMKEYQDVKGGLIIGLADAAYHLSIETTPTGFDVANLQDTVIKVGEASVFRLLPNQTSRNHVLNVMVQDDKGNSQEFVFTKYQNDVLGFSTVESDAEETRIDLGDAVRGEVENSPLKFSVQASQGGFLITNVAGAPLTLTIVGKSGKRQHVELAAEITAQNGEQLFWEALKSNRIIVAERLLVLLKKTVGFEAGKLAMLESAFKLRKKKDDAVRNWKYDFHMALLGGDFEKAIKVLEAVKLYVPEASFNQAEEELRRAEAEEVERIDKGGKDTPPWEILGVTEGEDSEVVKKAYRRLALKYHPDKNPGDKTAEERYKAVNKANELMSDPEKMDFYRRYGSKWEKFYLREKYPNPESKPKSAAMSSQLDWARSTVFDFLFADGNPHLMFDDIPAGYLVAYANQFRDLDPQKLDKAAKHVPSSLTGEGGSIEWAIDFILRDPKAYLKHARTLRDRYESLAPTWKVFPLTADMNDVDFRGIIINGVVKLLKGEPIGFHGNRRMVLEAAVAMSRHKNDVVIFKEHKDLIRQVLLENMDQGEGNIDRVKAAEGILNWNEEDGFIEPIEKAVSTIRHELMQFVESGVDLDDTSGWDEEKYYLLGFVIATFLKHERVFKGGDGYESLRDYADRIVNALIKAPVESPYGKFTQTNQKLCKVFIAGALLDRANPAMSSPSDDAQRVAVYLKQLPYHLSLLKDEDPRIHFPALTAVGRIAESLPPAHQEAKDQVVLRLYELLKTTTDDFVKEEIIYWLISVDLSNKRTFDYLHHLLKEGSSLEVQSVISGLASLEMNKLFGGFKQEASRYGYLFLLAWWVDIKRFLESKDEGIVHRVLSYLTTMKRLHQELPRRLGQEPLVFLRDDLKEQLMRVRGLLKNDFYKAKVDALLQEGDGDKVWESSPDLPNIGGQLKVNLTSPEQLVGDFIKEGRRVICLNAGLSFILLQGRVNGLLDQIITRSGITHIALPYPETSRQIIQDVVDGKAVDMDLLGNPYNDGLWIMGKDFRRVERDVTRVFLENLYRHGIEVIFYDNLSAGGLLGELRAIRRAQSIIEAAKADPKAKILVLGSLDMGRTSLLGNQQSRHTVAWQLVRELGEKSIASIVIEKHNFLPGENTDIPVGYYGFKVPGSPVAEQGYFIYRTKWRQAWDGVIVYKKPNDGDPGNRPEPRNPPAIAKKFEPEGDLVEDPGALALVNRAMTTKPAKTGGVDLKAKDLKLTEEGVGLEEASTIDPAMLAQLTSSDFAGLKPVIIDIQPFQVVLR